MTMTQSKLDKQLNKKLRRIERAYKRGRYCEDIYHRKRNNLITSYYAKSQRLEQGGTK